MRDEAVIDQVGQKYAALREVLDERVRRQWAASEAASIGWGGISKCLTESDPQLAEALDRLVDPMTRGHPETALRWTCKSRFKLADELSKTGHPVSDRTRTVARLLKEADYSLQANRKTQEGRAHPDRNAQFAHIHKQVLDFQKRHQPGVSVDTKKKEWVGNFKNPGREWQPSQQPVAVKTHDFPDPKLGKAIPYGVYDVTSNEGWVSVGINHDTAQLAGASLKHWWTEMGQRRFPRAKTLMITADGGGSNSYRNRLWKVEGVSATPGQRNQPDFVRVPLPARHEQMEQD